MIILVTDHFKKRVKERAGLNKIKAEELFNKALIKGFTYNECTNRPSLKRYLDNLKYNGENSIIVYDKYVIIKQKNIAITLLKLPKEYHSTIRSLQKKRGEQNGSKLCKNS